MPENDSAISINLASRVPVTEAEGPGRRFAIWVQGCPLRCPGCCNPQYLEFRPAEQITVASLFNEIVAVREQIQGITLIGGEPFSQPAPLAAIARMAQEIDLSVMIFTGFLAEQLHDPSAPDFKDRQALLQASDLLVDGPYIAAKHQTDRRWIGSSNQRIHFLTERYRHLEKSWDSGRNTTELRLINGKLTINGFPVSSITALSRSDRND